jgi:imidazolonepropionase-like amidohydrolase
MTKFIFLIIFFATGFLDLMAQNIEPQNGVYQSNNTLFAITNATINISSTEKIENGTLLFQNGVIKKVGKLVSIPKNAVVIDLKGYTLYPSFIDPYSSEAVTKRVSKKKSPYPQINSLTQGPYYWNEAIHPETNAYELVDQKTLKNKKALISQGFGVINTHQYDGISRGTSVLLTLADGNLKQNIIQSKVANHFSFSKGVSRQTYPSSQMGSIALLRQFYYDLKWYNSLKNKKFVNESFESIITNFNLPQIFGVSDKLEILRVLKIAKEFNLDFIIKGSGDEYQRIDELKSFSPKLIIPLNFPKPFDLTDPFISRYITLSSLKHWEMAPYNPYILEKNNVEFAFSSIGLTSKSDFLMNVRDAVKHGLSKAKALAALTSKPAEFLKVNDKIGSLDPGKIANFIVVKGDIFNDGIIYENWINGTKNVVKKRDLTDIRGKFDFKIGSKIYDAKIEGTLEKSKGKVTSYNMVKDSLTGTTKMDTLISKMTIDLKGEQVSISFSVKDDYNDGVIQLNGSVYEELGIFEGNALLPNGEWVKWNAVKNTAHKQEKSESIMKIDTTAISHTTFPNMAYGFDSLPHAKSYYIKNATLWTNEEAGVIKDANLLIVDGKIKTVNKKSQKIPNDAIVVDAKGKHVTSGIIDEHSHISISKGVNEGGQAISAEVSIADVVRSNDINVYRQLAGGVTSAQLLHGSANPIGGKSALIKLKWGYSPDEMLIKDAPGFIKFALGENVKQANWGAYNSIRFPQTRMGVEQVFYDAFTRAKLYKKQWSEYNKLSDKKKAESEAPRKDLEMETIVQILDSERFITCHSYVQSEINMLMHVADSMGFRMNTFTHILEGYKVADKMKAHGVGASTFSDWWAYKYEVNDAIPYNAAILHKAGILTALNSDDAEMGRRLNQEAAKIVKYGGVSEQDAWKMVTLNPAKLLHLDDRMGSVKVGKDADIVIWSDNPLSINAIVEKTFVDGILLYDLERNQELYERDQKDRKRILGLMLNAKNNGATTQKPVIKEHKHYHCDTFGE